MFSTIVLFFLSSALYDSVSGGERLEPSYIGEDCIAVSGPGKGKACVFPFKARGKEYTQCTKDGGFDNFWCSTKVDSIGNTVLGNYGDCPTNDPTNCFPEPNNENQDTATDRGECLTTGGAKKGVKCVFPFKARGTLYYECTTAGGFSTPWCSTKVDDTGNTVLGNWGDCPTKEENKSCYHEASEETTPAGFTGTTPRGTCLTISGAKRGVPCVFPFKARGVEYNECTKAGGFTTPWCSTQVDASGNTVLGNWGNCPVQGTGQEACYPSTEAPTVPSVSSSSDTSSTDSTSSSDASSSDFSSSDASSTDSSSSDSSSTDSSSSDSSSSDSSSSANSSSDASSSPDTTTSTTTTPETAPDGSSPIRGR